MTTNVQLSEEALANFRGRFFLLVDRSDEGCWQWLGPRHSSGAGRFLWKARDGGNDRYVLAHKVAYYLATGERPAYLRNLCGNKLCCKASHWWAKSERWKPKPRRAIRGRVRQLTDQQIQQIRLLDSFGSDEGEIGQQFGLTKRQVADIALGKVRTEAGDRIRTSRHRGIRYYHELFEQELGSLSMRPEEVVVPDSPVDRSPQVPPPPDNSRTCCPSPLAGPSPQCPTARIGDAYLELVVGNCAQSNRDQSGLLTSIGLHVGTQCGPQCPPPSFVSRKRHVLAFGRPHDDLGSTIEGVLP